LKRVSDVSKILRRVNTLIEEKSSKRLHGRIGHIYVIRRRIGHIYPLRKQGVRIGCESEIED